METLEITIVNKVGLHARPAAAFVRKAQGFKSIVNIENHTKKTEAVNAKSFVKLLSIAVDRDNVVRITAEGEDELQAVQCLKELIDDNFGEPTGD